LITRSKLKPTCFPPVTRFAPNTFFGGRAHFILVASVQEGRGLG